jgi:hypothetical protein
MRGPEVFHVQNQLGHHSDPLMDGAQNHILVHMGPELILLNVLMEQKAIEGFDINYFMDLQLGILVEVFR